MKKEILVVRREKLFGKNRTFNGFKSKDDARDIGLDEDFILTNGEYLLKTDLEHKPEYKQIVAYCVLLSEWGRMFSYKRAGIEEPRLKDRWSIGIGGHVRPLVERKSYNDIRSSLIKSIHNEVSVGSRTTGLPLLGYINCEDSENEDVNKDHLAVLFVKKVYDVDEIKPNPSAKDILEGKFRTQSEIEDIIKNHKLEEWSRIAYRELTKLNFKVK